ncbi:hypothetical protein [Ferdinandcohnia sp. Marseille-Q9671]
MLNQEYEVLLRKSVEVAPDWIKDDIQSILHKAGRQVGASYVISELHAIYTFGLRHILSSAHFSDEWTRVSRERLTFIDNNIDVIVAVFTHMKDR